MLASIKIHLQLKFIGFKMTTVLEDQIVDDIEKIRKSLINLEVGDGAQTLIEDMLGLLEATNIEQLILYDEYRKTNMNISKKEQEQEKELSSSMTAKFYPKTNVAIFIDNFSNTFH